MSAADDRERSIFLAALSKAASEERATYLDDACGGDLAMLARIRELLAAHEGSLGPLDAPPPGVGSAPTGNESVGEKPGAIVGPYKLIEQIGEGGFGVVFVAEQKQPVRRLVALKVLKPGMDTRQVIARFEAERQALAMMDHPNIAKVLEAGTTESGRLYFVMELVRGVPITQYCDERRLTPRQRLELFVPVCQAIQHAHQKGVIHRDIKPSNVMVALYDDRPVPKVIDFGVAKAATQPLTDKTLVTNIGALVGTLEYMSPEQASLNNLDIDTRSDVYSLGVLLYELLTGVTPLERPKLQQGALLEMLRIVREDDTPAPSAKLSTSAALASIAANRGMEPARLSEFMKGELDWVLLKALEKDRTRRYETASALARDIERYLADELVEARPPSTGYRLRKLARQHRAALTTTATVAVCLLLGVLVSSWLAFRAIRAEREAQISALRALEAQHDADRKREEAEAAQRDADQQRQTADQSRDEVQTQRDEAERQRAVAQSEKSAAQQNLVTSQFLLGKIANSNGDMAEALTWYFQAYRHTDADDPRRVSARNLIGANGGNLKQTLVHESGVHTVAISADGRKLVTGYYHSRAQVWDLVTGMPLGAPLSHHGDIVSAQLSADGSFALIGDWNGAKVWDTATGKLRYPELAHEVREDTVVGPVLSPDGRTIVTRSPFTGIRLWDAETGEPRGESLPLGKFVYRMCFSPDCKLVAAWGDGVAQVWNAETAQPVGGPFSNVSDLDFHPANHIVAVSRNDGKVLLHDLDAGMQTAELTHDKPLASVDFDKEGKRLVARDDENAVVWSNVLTGERTQRVVPHGRGLFAASFNSANGWLLTASPLALRVWKVGADAPLWERITPMNVARLRSDRVKSAEFSPDGKSLLTLLETNTAEVLSAKTGQLQVREANVVRATFDVEGKSLIVGSRDGWARVRSLDADEQRRLPKRLGRDVCSGSTLAVSPDGTLVFVVGAKQSAIYRTDTWEPVGKPLEGLYHDFKDMVTGAAFSPDGRLLVTAMHLRGSGPPPTFGGAKCRITFWDVASGTARGELNSASPPLSDVTFDTTGDNVRIGGAIFDVHQRSERKYDAASIPSGHRLVAQLLGNSNVPALPLWDNKLGVPTTMSAPEGKFKHLLLTADGRHWLVVEMDGSARLRDAVTGEPRGAAFKTDGFATELTRDGRYVIFRTPNANTLWDTHLGRRCSDSLQSEPGQLAAAFNPEGTMLATTLHFSAQLWDCATGMALGAPLALPSNSGARPVFSPDGRQLFIPSSGLEVCRVPAPAADDPERLKLSIEVRTGFEVDDTSALHKLSHASWLERKRRLNELGGPCDLVNR